MPVATVVRVHPGSDSVAVKSALNNIHLWDDKGAKRQWFARCAVDDISPAVPPRCASNDEFWEAVKEPVMSGMRNNVPHCAVIVAGATHSGKSFSLFGDWVGDAKLSETPPANVGIVTRFYQELFQQQEQQQSAEGAVGAVEAVDIGMVVVIQEVAYDLFHNAQSYHYQKDLTTHPLSGSQFSGQQWMTCTTFEQAARALRVSLINFGHIMLEHGRVNTPVQLFVFNRIWTPTHLVYYTFAELDLRHAAEDIFMEDHLAYHAKVDQSGRALCKAATSLASNDSIEESQFVCSGGAASYLLLPSLLSGSFMVIACVNGKTPYYRDNCTVLDFMTELGADRASWVLQPRIQRAAMLQAIKQVTAQLTAASSATCKAVLDSLATRSLQKHIHAQQRSIEALDALIAELETRGFCVANEWSVERRADPYIRLVVDNALACSMFVRLDRISTVLGAAQQYSEERDEERHVCIPGIGVLARHVRLARINGGVELRPVEDAICFVNSQAVASPITLKDQDIIVLGVSVVLQVCASPSQGGRGPATDWATAMEVLTAPSIKAVNEAWSSYRKELHHIKADRQMEVLRKRASGGESHREPSSRTKERLELADSCVPPTSLAELVFGVRIASFISSQMAMSVSFKLATIGRPRPNGHAERAAADQPSIDAADSSGSCGIVSVQAAVIDPQSGHVRSSALWSPAKWCNRLAMMERMYRDYLLLDDTHKLEELYPEELWPFRERSGHELVGVAFLHLNPFMYLLDVRDSLPIMDFNGETAGYLALNGRVWIDEIEPNPTYLTVDKEAHLMDFVGRNLVLKLFFESLHNLPEQHCQDVHVSFRFHFHRHAYTTPQVSQATCNPRLDSVICITQRITADLLEHVERGAIELEVWACRPQLVSLEASHLVGDARHQFHQRFEQPKLSGLQNGGAATSSSATRKSFLAANGSGGELVQDRKRGSLSGERLAQQKHLQLRMNVQGHERNAALLAVKQAEDRLDKLAAENAALQRELEEMRQQAAPRTTDPATSEPSSGRRVVSKVCSVS